MGPVTYENREVIRTHFPQSTRLRKIHFYRLTNIEFAYNRNYLMGGSIHNQTVEEEAAVFSYG